MQRNCTGWLVLVPILGQKAQTHKSTGTRSVVLLTCHDKSSGAASMGNPYFPDYWENELILLGLFSELTPSLDPYPVPFSDPLKN